MPSLFSYPDKIKRYGGIAFGITARKYCPQADYDNPLSPCNICYAWERNLYRMPSVKNAYAWRGELTKRNDFVTIVNWELYQLKHRPKFFRIHDSGDFYSDGYMQKWLDIINTNPDIHFYCYTKEIRRMLDFLGDVPNDAIENFTVCFSYGGKQDHWINPEIHLHSYVFHDLDTLKRCGFEDASYDDLTMIYTNNLAIGLVEH